MATRAQRKQQFFNRQFPDAELPSHDGKTADYHLLALIIILALDEATRDNVYKDDGTIDPTALLQHEKYAHAIDASRVGAAHFAALAPYLDAFRGVKMAWAALDEYNPEPCPRLEALAVLAAATKNLPGSGSTL